MECPPEEITEDNIVELKMVEYPFNPTPLSFEVTLPEGFVLRDPSSLPSSIVIKEK